MCGICGIVWNDPNRPIPPGQIEAMAERLRHRGPDGHGYYIDHGVALGHRRLSIIDLAGGKQPLANEDDSVWVSFNGEIYNFHTLRRELLAKGHRFKTHSDTEVLVHLWEDDGPAMLERLRGMFALALWDARQRSLFLARDRLGKKPLVYWHDSAGLRFASELKAFLVEPSFPRTIDETAIDDYLTYQYIPHPKTVFRAAKKLPPGHYAVWRDGALVVRRYWSPPFEEEKPGTAEEYAERLQATLREATRLRLISDVPLGAFLSGGIDSTIVVGLMREISNAPVKTFSIGFPVKEFDETSYARAAARHLGTDHHEFVVEPEAVAIVEVLAEYFDEPFADSSAIPTYYVSKLTRQHVTVALTGDAGDELFGGYERYLAVQVREKLARLPKWVQGLAGWRGWQALPAPATQKSRLRRAKKLASFLGHPPRDFYRQFVTICGDELRARLYTPEFAGRLQGHRPADWIERWYAELPQRDLLTQTMFVDVNTYLPGDILTKVDMASMANSLECRAPFLDHEVVALAGRMPRALKIQGVTTKALLKQAFVKYLPPEIRRRGKMGFGVPLDHWFRHELAPMLRETLAPSQVSRRGWFHPATVEALIDEHLTRRRDHSARLWALLMLERWAQTYLDR